MLDKDRILAKVRMMAKVTSKLQLTIPKAIADQYGIRPGDELNLEPTGEAIRVTSPGRRTRTLDVRTRLRLFDEATQRQRRREQGLPAPTPANVCAADERRWKRGDLYTRGWLRH